jgi:hypothetical protein
MNSYLQTFITKSHCKLKNSQYFYEREANRQWSHLWQKARETKDFIGSNGLNYACMAGTKIKETWACDFWSFSFFY